MTTFAILRVHWGADAEYVKAEGQPEEMHLHHFCDVTVRFLDGFDWERDGGKLLKRMQAAVGLNREDES